MRKAMLLSIISGLIFLIAGCAVETVTYGPDHCNDPRYSGINCNPYSVNNYMSNTGYVLRP